jgi:uncharacterized protein
MKAIRLIAAFAAASALLLVGSASAAEPAAPSASAQELAKLLVPKETYAVGMKQLAGSVQANLQRHPGANLQYPADLPTKAQAEVEAALPYDDLVGMHAKELGKAYTEQEMKDLSAFVRSPIGKKWLEAQPKVSEAVALETQQRFGQKMPDIMKKLSALAKVPEHGAKADAEKAVEAPKKAADTAKKPAAKKAAEPAKPAAK